YGQTVIFLSERFPHEVIPAQRDRYTIAGWYRVNNNLQGRIDPPS
ncbi:MAG: 2OG-Fe(II) oxygenase, partial [Candidatus Thiodiazotropha sp.]